MGGLKSSGKAQGGRRVLHLAAFPARDQLFIVGLGVPRGDHVISCKRSAFCCGLGVLRGDHVISCK